MSKDNDGNSVEGSAETPKPPGMGALMLLSIVVVTHGADWISAITDFIGTVTSI